MSPAWPETGAVERPPGTQPREGVGGGRGGTSSPSCDEEQNESCWQVAPHFIFADSSIINWNTFNATGSKKERWYLWYSNKLVWYYKQ